MWLEFSFIVFMVLAFLANGWFCRKLLLTVSLLVFPFMLHAQNCDTIVVDDANMFGNKLPLVLKAANGVIDQGADVRVRTVPNSGGNLDILEGRIENACASWQAAKPGVRKSTLVVLIASADHKLGIYYGSEWHKALDNNWNRIKTDYMVKRFQDGNFAGGFIAGLQQIQGRLVASKDESLHPAVHQTVNQATDYSGLWTVLRWLIAVGVFIWLVFTIGIFLSKRRRAREVLRAAQTSAKNELNDAASALNRLSDIIDEQKATGKTVSSTAEALFSEASADFARVRGELSSDPNDNNLTVVEYNAITSRYRSIRQKLGDVAVELSGGKERKLSPYTKTATQVQNDQINTNGTVSVVPAPAVKSYSGPEYVPVSSPVSTSTVVVVNNDNERDSDHDYSRYRQYEPESDPPKRTDPAITRDSGGGGSSSWAEPERDEPEESSGGGSSVFDSVSSDSGGGGSGDW